MAPKVRDLIEVEVVDAGATDGFGTHGDGLAGEAGGFGQGAVPGEVGAVGETDGLNDGLGQQHAEGRMGIRPEASAEWRLAEVRRVLPDGRFQACVYDATGRPDNEFIEWYSRMDEGKDWRRRTDESLQPVVDPHSRPLPRGGRGRVFKRKRRDKWT